MFKKLVSNLPYNHGLIRQVAFYGKRLRAEESIRRSGFALLAIALVLQIFAAVSPPEHSLAASNNDIIRGGFTSKKQAVNLCRNNTQNFKKILAYYRVSCEQLGNASITNIKSTAYNDRLDSMGRVPQGPKIMRTGKKTNEYKVAIGNNKYYMRNLWSWDSRSYSSYKVLKMKNEDGKTIMVMFNCGNIITVDKYQPPKMPEPKEPEEPKQDVCEDLPGLQTTEEECDVCPNVPGIQNSAEECYPCPESKDNDDLTACLELEKNAVNQTQSLDEADGTMAFGGDIIDYELSVTNTGSHTVKDFVIDENMTDVLEYATIVDLGGGTLDSDQTVVWPEQDIAPNEEIEKKITVKVKDPVPQTPASSSDPNSYDLVMANVFYGDTVQIELPKGIVKTTEQLATSLPETGPGSAIAFAFAITTFSSYFLARSRILAKEIDEVRKEFINAGEDKKT